MMLYDMIAILPAAGTAALAAVYLASKDPGRRARARELLKLLLRR
jgi:hypothetical protein